jgi:hypothetical protein
MLLKYRRLLILIGIVVILAWLSSYSYVVERYYSAGVYPYYARVLRWVFGWLPFSIGDVVYFGVGLWLCIRTVGLIQTLVRKQWPLRQWLTWSRRFIESILIIVIVFNLGWALNYSRLGIAYQLGLKPGLYSNDTLQNLIDSLTVKVNESRRALPDSTLPLSTRQIAREAFEAYRITQTDTLLSFLQYHPLSVKGSLYGSLGNYLGFSGYYNPFSGEAQVNTTVPFFTQPYTTCHEMAHQLGYASESEANFVGYLAAAHSRDPRFQYSTYFDLFSYANREMFLRDSSAARRNYRSLDTLVKKDYKVLVLFYRAHRNPLEPILNKMYDGYLKANHQQNGIESYNEVTGWLLAYRKKYGRL